MARFGGVAATVVCASAVAAQGASVVSDLRTISAAAGAGQVSDSDSATATFGSIFDQTVDAVAENENLGVRSRSDASQFSSIAFPTVDSFVITIRLGAGVGAEVLGEFPGGSATAHGESVFDVTLRLDGSYSFELEGQSTRTGSQPDTTFSIFGIEYDPVTPEPGVTSFDETGLVGPGDYRLLAGATATLQGFNEETSSLELTIRGTRIDGGTVIPTPAAAGMGLVLLGGAALRRRR